MSTNTKTWQKFEQLISILERQTAPKGAEVKHNHRIKGRSGRMRQIDVSVSHKVGIHRVFIVIECKQYNQAVKIDKIEAFASKLEDIRATQGVMISEKGFDEGAKAVAKDRGITLLTYKQANNIDWEATFEESAWIKIMFTEVERLSIGVKSDNFPPSYKLTPQAQLYNLEGVAIYKLYDLFKEIFSRNTRNFSLGENFLEIGLERPQLIITDRKERIKVDAIGFRFVVVAKEYAFNPDLLEGQVIRDEISGELVFQHLISNGVNIKELVNRQEGRVLTSEEYERLGANGQIMAATFDELHDTYYFAYRFGAPPPENA